MAEFGIIDELIAGEIYRLQDDPSKDPALLKPFRQDGIDRAKVLHIYEGRGVSTVSFDVQDADGNPGYTQPIQLFVGTFMLHYRKICEQNP